MNYPIYVDGSIPVEVLLGLFANAGMRLRCNLKSELVVEARPVVPTTLTGTAIRLRLPLPEGY